MSDGTTIEWTEATWNPITGCSVTSPGCTNCYAMKLAGTRLRNHESRAGLTVESKAGPVWTGEVRLNEQWLDQPLRWKRPRMIFVCAHGDLFHESVPDEWIDKVFAVMALAPQHTFQVLTKRSKRMRDFFAESTGWRARIAGLLNEMKPSPLWNGNVHQGWQNLHGRADGLPNVWLGVSAENQHWLMQRACDLVETPAAVRWLSCEPLLGQIDVEPFVNPVSDWSNGWANNYPFSYPKHRIDWIVVGGESGPGARPMHPDWARSLRDQCEAAGVPFFFKQWGAYAPLLKAHPVDMADNIPIAWPDGTIGSGQADRNGGRGRQLYLATKKIAGRTLDGREHDGMPT
jgi:protein gp37